MSSSPIDPDPAASRPVPAWLGRAGAGAWWVVGIGLVVWGMAELAQMTAVVVVPVLVALLLTAVLEPAVGRVGRGPDWLAPLAAVLLLLALTVGVVVGIATRIGDQLPQLRDDLQSAVADVEDRLSVKVPAIPGSDGSGGGGGLSGGPAAEVLRLGVELLFGLFLTLALTFLFLKDGRSLWRWFLDKLGDRARADVDASGRAAWGTLGAYVRGLTVVAAFDALGIAVGLLALGVPLVLTLATLQFVASYVPTIGAFAAGGAAVLVAFAEGGLTTGALVVALVVVVQQVGNNVIEPWVLGRRIPLHPSMVLIAVSVGAALWGVPGALLFVPLAAAGSAVGHVLWERHRRPPS